MPRTPGEQRALLASAERLEARNRALREALKQIVEKARWYADNDVRDPQEVDHALCVEVLALAEDALDG